MMSFMNHAGRAATALAIAALAGCAQPAKTLYHWEGYQAQLYEYFKGGEGSDSQEQLRKLQAQAEKAQGKGAALPPGFRAHVGLLDLNLGRPDEAKQQFEAEKAAFPESTPYMDFLLRRMSAPAPQPQAAPAPAQKTESKPAAKTTPKAAPKAPAVKPAKP